jgi:hypothetical protein
VYYQWRVNGAAIPGATRPSYTTPLLTNIDNDKRYSVMVSVAGRDTASQEATLSVVAGEPPTMEAFIGANFTGAGSGIRGALTATDVAGVVPQENWNNLSRTNAAAIPLTNATGAAGPVTLTYSGRVQWHSGAGAALDADSLLLHGYLHTSSAPGPATFAFNGVPAGNYHVLVYSVGFDSVTPYDQNYSITGAGSYPTYHGRAQTGPAYLQNPTFKRMSSTNPNAGDSGNFVQFENVSPSANGSFTITVAATSSGNVHAPAVNAIQLVRASVALAPNLTFARTAAGALTISWTSAANGFALEARDAIDGNANWRLVPGVPIPISEAGSVTVPTIGAMQFYRLGTP